MAIIQGIERAKKPSHATVPLITACGKIQTGCGQLLGNNEKNSKVSLKIYLAWRTWQAHIAIDRPT